MNQYQIGDHVTTAHVSGEIIAILHNGLGYTIRISATRNIDILHAQIIPQAQS